MLCAICQKYHADKHPMEELKKKYQENARKLNQKLTKKQRSNAAVKGWKKRKKDSKNKALTV